MKTTRAERLSTRQRAETVFSRLAAADPAPTTELAYGNTFQLLVAVILSAQATDTGVNKATADLFTVVKTAAEMVALGEAGLKEHIKSIGLFNSKAKNVIAASRMLVERHDGQVPATREALEALPGVGRKTANVVLNTAFGEPTIAVDTHIFRVANRLGIARGKTPRQIEDKLIRIVPDRYLRHAHHWLILHGRYVCTARSPRCDICRLTDLCTWYRRHRADRTSGVSGSG